MAAELEPDRLRRAALDGDLFTNDPQRLPPVLPAHLVRIRRIDFLDVDIVLIGADDRQPPGDPVVVTETDADERRFARADDVPAWRVQVKDVAQRRIADLAVRIV